MQSISFNPAMLAAVRTGNKTVTRRRLSLNLVVQHEPDHYQFFRFDKEGVMFEATGAEGGTLLPPIYCPFGKEGDLVPIQEEPTLMLQIVSVRVKQVRNITEADAIAEGIHQKQSNGRRQWGGVEPDGTLPGSFHWYDSPVAAFRGLFNSIYPTAWARNEWVWVVEFVKLS